MYRITRILTCALTLACSAVFAQERIVYGVATDSTDRSTLVGVTVLLISANDTTQFRGTVTDEDGKFSFAQVSPGNYKVKLTYIGYSPRVIDISVKDKSVELGNIAISQAVTTLETVKVTGTAIQVEQKGDTIQYNADAFKTNPDATAEDLINKMPGMTSDGSGLKAQGETVQKVLVDGREFFGNDASIALKNLPAEIIEKIEVFDRMSEQSQFTGFDDGETQKTVNIVTKSGRNQGQFGRLYAGAGEDGRYTAGGNINSFKGDSRLSLIGMSNNVNQQNFSNEDLLGVMAPSRSGGGRGGRGGGRGGNAGNFSAGNQAGISTTHSIGLNYSDNWGEKTVVSGSYFFNKSDNERISDLTRQYITARDSGLVYQEASRSNAANYNHRFNLRLEHKIDSANSIVFTPRLSFQQNTSLSSLMGNYSGIESDLERLLDNRNDAQNNGYNLSSNLVYRHRFKKRGRTFSVGLNTDVNNRDGNSGLMSQDEDQASGQFNIVDQHTDNFTNSLTISPNISYTEPIGRQSQLQLSYTPSYRFSETDKKTRSFSQETDNYSDLDTLLSNTFDNTYTTQRAGLSYRFNNRKLMLNTSVNMQQARLRSSQEFPYQFSIDRSFANILPQLIANYRFTRTENLNLTYRTSTNAPSVNQLQNVVDNRNPLFLRTGNPELSQNFGHNLMLRYGKTNPENSSSLLVMAAASLVNNYITNTTLIATSDTVVNDIPLSRGTQLSFPVNVDGYRTARTLITYGFPLQPIRSNINLNTGFNYNRIPALINGAGNLANNYAFSEGVVVSSNISENLDFTVSYTANYTVVKNSLQKQSDNNYFNQTASLRLNWLFYKGFVFTSNLNHSRYQGLAANFDQAIWFWNAGLGYKFLKDQSLEVKVNAFDILNRNNSIIRDITETFIEDRQTNVLTRYFMLTLAYQIRRFNA